jgi:hypothetical protein
MKKIKSDIDIYMELIEQNEITSIRELIAPLNDELIALCEKRTTLTSKLDTLKINKAKSDKKKTDWADILHSEYHDSLCKSNYRQEKLRDIGLESSGFFQDTNQAAIQIRLINGKPETKNKTLKGISTLLPYIKPIKGQIRFCIFESTLCEYGIYNLVLGKKWELTFTRYSHTTTEKTFDTLKEAIEYIYENHYYEKV